MSEVNHYGRVIEMAGPFSPEALAQVEHVLVIASNTQASTARSSPTTPNARATGPDY